MRLDPNEQIAGLPVLEVRKLLRQTIDTQAWNLLFIKRLLPLSTLKARTLLAEMLAQELIEPSPTFRGMWRNTSNGNAFAGATAAKPLRRESAQKSLDEFMERVRYVNSVDCPFISWIGKVVLLGSMLTDRPRVSDVDISVRLDRKYKGEAHSEASTERVQAAIRNGRHFPGYIQQLCWPEREIWLYLKNRVRSISLIEWNEDWLRTQPHKVLYERK